MPRNNTTTTSRTYRFGDVVLHMESDTARLLDFFERDVGPFISPVPVGTRTARHDIRVLVGQAGPDALPTVPGDAESMVLHPRDVPLSGRRWYEGEDTLIHNPHFPGVYRIRGRDIRITCAGDDFHAYIGLRLTLFPLLYRLSDRMGSLTIHSSAVSGPHGGLLFCGAKGAGKTSISLTLAAVSGYFFLTNDYTVVTHPDGDSAGLLGTPEPIRIAAGTFQALHRQLQRYEDAEVFLDKRYLHVRDIRDHFHLVPAADLRAVFLPRLIDDGELTIEDTEPRAAVDEIVGQAMEIGGYQTPKLVDPGGFLSHDVVRKRVTTLVQHTRVCRITVPLRCVGTGDIAHALDQWARTDPLSEQRAAMPGAG